jgi:radical SAM protein with 4Fe4S-binding SPASM domain
MNKSFEDKIKSFILRTKDVLYLRDADKIMIIRPNKIQHLNDTAFDILNHLYQKNITLTETVDILASKYKITKERITNDINLLLQSIDAIVNENYSKAVLVNTIKFDPYSIKYPVLSEIALTYRCQNKCEFCYASSPFRGSKEEEMTTEEIKGIIHKTRYDANVPTISFTGGEPTLRKDLPELIKYASSIGMRTNLITNGIKCADKNFVDELAKAGLNSAQVSLESHDEEIHNSIVGNKNAYKKVIQGIKNLKDTDIFTHTNTTICMGNKDHLIPLVKFIKEEFNNAFLSMNMIIATGIAKDNENIDIGYSSIGKIVEPVIEYSERIDIKFVWYSPTPYCIFNPIDHNLGAKSCACVSGLLSINPKGEIIPCSSFDKGIGSLLKHSFEYIWNSDKAIYWREKRYMPPVCKDCEYDDICGGACPLYWENAGSFKEIEDVKKQKSFFKNIFWNIEKKFRVNTKGVDGIS